MRPPRSGSSDGPVSQTIRESARQSLCVCCDRVGRIRVRCAMCCSLSMLDSCVCSLFPLGWPGFSCLVSVFSVVHLRMACLICARCLVLFPAVSGSGGPQILLYDVVHMGLLQPLSKDRPPPAVTTKAFLWLLHDALIEAKRLPARPKDSPPSNDAGKICGQWGWTMPDPKQFPLVMPVPQLPPDYDARDLGQAGAKQAPPPPRGSQASGSAGGQSAGGANTAPAAAAGAGAAPKT